MEEEAPETEPALWMEALMGNDEEVRRLVAAGADIEETSRTLKTRPLHVAATMNHTVVQHTSSCCTPPPCACSAFCSAPMLDALCWKDRCVSSDLPPLGLAGHGGQD